MCINSFRYLLIKHTPKITLDILTEIKKKLNKPYNTHKSEETKYRCHTIIFLITIQ